MQHVSIVLAFCAVFGLAVFRLVGESGEDVKNVAARASNEYAHQRYANQELRKQLGYLSHRIGALETDLGSLRTTNAQLNKTIKELNARSGLTTASISRRQRRSASQFRKSNSEGSALPVLQGSVGLHLATFTDLNALATAWRSLSRSESKTLNGLVPYARAVSSASGKTLYRLIAGPLGSERDARARCTLIKQRGRFCEPAKRIGEPLSRLLAQN